MQEMRPHGALGCSIDFEDCLSSSEAVRLFSLKRMRPAGSWWPFIMMSALRLKSIQYLQDGRWRNINRIIQMHTHGTAISHRRSVHLCIDLLVADSVMGLGNSDYCKQTGCLCFLSGSKFDNGCQ